MSMTELHCARCEQVLSEGVEKCPTCGWPVAVPARSTPSASPTASSYMPRQRSDSERPVAGEPPRDTQTDSAFRHRPARFESARLWIRSGALRDPWSVTVALIVTWFYVPLAVLNGVAGMLAGAAFGAFGGATTLIDLPLVGQYFDLFSFQVGGVLGALVGATVGLVLGVVTGLAGPWLLASQGDPYEALFFALGQVLAAIFIGLLYAIYAARSEGWRLRLHGARRPSRREHALLAPLLEQSASSLGIKGGLPRLLMDDNREPNASAHLGHIVVNVGLLEELQYDKGALAAVLCHELQHWNSSDTMSSTFVRGVALPLYLVYNGLTAIMRTFSHPVVQFVLVVLTWPLFFCVRYLIVPAQSRGSRAAEYAADQAAVLAGNRAGIRRVLGLFRTSFDGARNGWDASICATHPPSELRLERVEEPGATYGLPDDNAPARPLPVTLTSSLHRD